MRTSVILTTLVVVATAASPRSAHAQYGYGGWGSTVQGSMARGAGFFNAGVGERNLLDAQAGSINTDTVLRWNEALWEAQRGLNQSYYMRMQQRQAKIDKSQAEIYDRIRNHPETRDIQDGDALNALLVIYQNPAVARSSYRLVKAPLSRETIQDIPFEFASEGMTICLDQITTQEGWPLALRDDAFESDRQAIRKAVQNALEEDERGDLRPKTIQKVGDAVAALRQKFQKTVPTTSPDYISARDYLKTLAGLTHMLHSPKVDEILAELERYEGSTAGDLLVFMQAFNLRFAPAKSFHQRQTYMRLYPILLEPIDGALSSVARNVEPGASGPLKSAEKAASDLGSAASSLFKGMNWDHLENPPKPQK